MFNLRDTFICSLRKIKGDKESTSHSKEDAKKIYYCDYWLKGRCDEIKNEVIAAKFFDLVVNVGIKTATRLIQRALRSVDSYVIEDGILGQKTLGAINELIRPSLLLVALKSEAAGYYRTLATSNKSQEKFLAEWLNRAYRHMVV